MSLAIVTGASTGIGRAVAVALGGLGYDVVLVGRNASELEETKRLALEAGGVVEVRLVDLANRANLDEFLKYMRGKDEVDVLVNVAGVWHNETEAYAGIDFEKFDENVIRETYEVGIIAPTVLAHSLIPKMQNGGDIVNISGTFSDGAKGWLPYYVSKRALEDLTVGLSDELTNRRVKVNAVSPSDVATEAYERFFPEYIADAVGPEEIAEAVIELIRGNDTGKIIVVKKGVKSYEGFHE